MLKTIPTWQQTTESYKERLAQPLAWFPYPWLISASFILIFSSHILFGLNPRLGNPANVPALDAPPSYEGSIWMSVSLQDQDVVIVTADRKIFRWSNHLSNKVVNSNFSE